MRKDGIEILDQLAASQMKRMHNFAKEMYPKITEDDLWQPNDFPLLEQNPFFRYEEGALSGILQAKAALLASNNL
jgi:hypothetical protein